MARNTRSNAAAIAASRALWVLALAAALSCAGDYAARADSAAAGSGQAVKRIWADRGALTPAQVYFGQASADAAPLSRLPAPPYSKFETDDKPDKFSPKCYVTDSNGVKWTVKFGLEVHSDVTAPRLAWALGFESDEDYFVPGGTIEGVTKDTKRGKESASVSDTGAFGAARFKRHPEHHVKDDKDNTIFWDESVNPGVPQQQLDGLILLDNLVFNWDAQPKNCEVLHQKSDSGPVDWYIMSDWGQSFGRVKHPWSIADYQTAPYITAVNAATVTFNFADPDKQDLRAHQQVPTADVQWFRKLVDKLTDDEIEAAFNAGVATPDLTAAYAAGDMDKVHALTTSDVKAFAAALRRRIGELDSKVPAAP